MKSNIQAGQHKLRGKKIRLLKCKCCEIIDFRDKELKKIHDKEICKSKENYREGML